MSKVQMRTVNCRIWLLTLLITINTSYADEINSNIYGKFDAGEFKLHLECYGTKSPSIIVHSGFNGYGSEGEW